jgi:hypothetical protein
MTVKSDNLFWDNEKNQWKDTEDNVGYTHKRVCQKCKKPRLDINGVKDCDFCLQGLTTCSFIDNACCGHGNDENAYISLKDGRLFVLSEWSVKE